MREKEKPLPAKRKLFLLAATGRIFFQCWCHPGEAPPMATLVLGGRETRRQVTFERNPGEQNGRTKRDVHKTEEDVEERCGRKPGRWHETLPKMISYMKQGPRDLIAILYRN